MIDVIKEYLVSLGMSVDKKSFDEANKTMQTLEKGVKSSAGSIVKSFTIAGAAMASAMVTATIGIASFLGSLAKADLENEKFARRMWMSKETATELNNTLKAMNATVEDLYLSPELLRNFQQLRSTIAEMKPPPEFQQQMKTIRSITLEFQRMRLEMTYGLQWIGFYLFKYLEGPIKNIKGGLQGFNDSITKSMPHWTKNVAQFLSWIGRLGIAMVKGGRDVLRIFDELADHIPQKLKVIGIAVAALGLIIKSGPIGVAMTLITSLLLLLDDFYTYLEGGESALAPMWKKLQGFYNLLKDTGVIKRFGNAIDGAARTAEEGLEKVWNWLVSLYNKFEDNGSIENFGKGIETNFGTAIQMVKDFGSWVEKVFDKLNSDGTLSGLEDSFVSLGKEIAEDYKSLAEFIQKIYGLEETKELLQWIGDFFSGTLKVALESLKFSIDNMVNGIKMAKALLSGDDEALNKAWEERKELTSQTFDKVKGGLNSLFGDAPEPAPANTTESSKQTDKLNTSVNNLPKGMEPSFKKALNESEVVKGFRGFNQDMNKGFNLLAMAINPDVFQQYQDMSTGNLPNSYMYTTNATSNQTVIKNENKPVFYISSTDPKNAAQEVEQRWSGMNIRSVRGVYG
ncbi:hypothetical protein ACQCN2_01100 [Brevibacillus ginsengisoli]|uniref:hypothetical protein n=1 Tax=Brevibacillus ginsengisoli TaxID=363854 RepID=UPI003CF5AE4E